MLLHSNNGNFLPTKFEWVMVNIIEHMFACCQVAAWDFFVDTADLPLQYVLKINVKCIDTLFVS